MERFGYIKEGDCAETVAAGNIREGEGMVNGASFLVLAGVWTCGGTHSWRWETLQEEAICLQKGGEMGLVLNIIG